MEEWVYRSKFSWSWHYLQVSYQFHVPAALPPRGTQRYPLHRKLGGPQSRSRRYEKWNFLTLPGLEIRPLSRPISSKSLYRLHYRGCSQRLIRGIYELCYRVLLWCKDIYVRSHKDLFSHSRINRMTYRHADRCRLYKPIFIFSK
jgi:hypothetical protein